MSSHRDLEVWRRSHALGSRVFRLTGGAVADESRALVDQVRRSSESIADNIAEGHAGRTKGVYRRHIAIALGSAAECDSQLVRLRDRQAWPPELSADVLDELATIRRMLLALERAVKRRPK